MNNGTLCKFKVKTASRPKYAASLRHLELSILTHQNGLNALKRGLGFRAIFFIFILQYTICPAYKCALFIKRTTGGKQDRPFGVMHTKCTGNCLETHYK